MTILNNKKYLKTTRQELRNNATLAEVYIWKYLQGKKLDGYKFRRQHSINRYILDFYCPELYLGIELDGKIHNDRQEYDDIRTEYLEACGLHIIRFSNEEVLENIENTLQKIKEHINKNYGK